MAIGFRNLIEFDGDVESTFCRDFTIRYDFFGGERVVELKENGANIQLNNENREGVCHCAYSMYCHTVCVYRIRRFVR